MSLVLRVGKGEAVISSQRLLGCAPPALSQHASLFSYLSLFRSHTNGPFPENRPYPDTKQSYLFIFVLDNVNQTIAIYHKWIQLWVGILFLETKLKKNSELNQKTIMDD